MFGNCGVRATESQKLTTRELARNHTNLETKKSSPKPGFIDDFPQKKLLKRFFTQSESHMITEKTVKVTKIYTLETLLSK